MRTVKLIDDNWKNKPQWLQNVLTVGDPIPVLNGIYTVSSYFYDENMKITAYQLAEFDYTSYNSAGLFGVDHFETVIDKHEPNVFINLCGMDFLAEKQKMWLTIDAEDLKYLDLELTLVTVDKKDY